MKNNIVNNYLILFAVTLLFVIGVIFLHQSGNQIRTIPYLSPTPLPPGFSSGGGNGNGSNANTFPANPLLSPTIPEFSEPSQTKELISPTMTPPSPT